MGSGIGCRTGYLRSKHAALRIMQVCQIGIYTDRIWNIRIFGKRNRNCFHQFIICLFCLENIRRSRNSKQFSHIRSAVILIIIIIIIRGLKIKDPCSILNCLIVIGKPEITVDTVLRLVRPAVSAKPCSVSCRFIFKRRCRKIIIPAHNIYCMVRCNTACRAVIGCHILSCFCIDCRSHIVGRSVHIQSQPGRSVLHNLTFHLGNIFVNINNIYILQMCHILIKSVTFCQCRGGRCQSVRYTVLVRHPFPLQKRPAREIQISAHGQIIFMVHNI